MRFPNLRYGKPVELEYYAMGRPLAELARILRRDERTIRDWLSGRARVPWWVPEILRLKRVEADLMYRQMFWKLDTKPNVHQLGVVAPDGALERAEPKKKPQVTDLRLDDFETAAVSAGPALTDRTTALRGGQSGPVAA